jgi:hypothetical protein
MCAWFCQKTNLRAVALLIVVTLYPLLLILLQI